LSDPFKRRNTIDTKIATERRSEAPHPGPIVRRDFLEPLGQDHRSFAAHIGLDPERVYAILSGALPLDAEVAVRFARALGVPAEKLMQMQLRFDFAVARARPVVARLEPVRPAGPPSFPAHDFLCGRLRRTSDGFGEGSLFFQEDMPTRSDRDLHAGLHALWFGDRLRVYEPRGAVIWTGPVLQNLDGRILLPYERPAVWNAWFVSGFRADLAIGEEHRAFFRRMEA
jgi:addiction module HigA family antidote